MNYLVSKHTRAFLQALDYQKVTTLRITDVSLLVWGCNMTDFDKWYALHDPDLSRFHRMPDLFETVQQAFEAGAASQAETLRDKFAGQALHGVMVTCQNDTRVLNETTPESFARKSYEMADAMLESRKQK
jgi:hypothetical protein